MENIDNENLFDGMEETPMDVVSWDGSVKFWEYEDLWASDYLESTNNPKIESNDTDTAYNDELELQYWDANVDEEYNYWKMKKWYDEEQEVLWEVLQETSPKNNKQTKMLLEKTLLDDYQDLAA